MKDISERIRAVIRENAAEKGRTAILQANTGIAAETWRKLISGKQNATASVVEAVSTLWPKYAFWIATGITDSAYGHVAPNTAYEDSINRRRQSREGANLYFRMKIDLLEGRKPNFKIEEVLPKPYEGKYTTLAEKESWDSVAAKQEYENANEEEKLRLEIESFRQSEQMIKQAIDNFLKYGN